MHPTRSFTTAFLLALGASPGVLGVYTLKDDYTPSSFFSMFNFFTGTDPTNGLVKYLDQTAATSQGLISMTASSVYIGVDHSNTAPNGRNSVRIQSKNLYTHGLFILNLAHMPSSVCGTGPSFWTYGSQQTWSANGEIDIIEGVHTQAKNSMALHTADGCTISGVNETGTVSTSNCYVNAAGQSSNAGCNIASTSASSYGTAFNAAGGGVYAMEWTSSAIKIWYFPQASIPSDITSGSPNPSGWGLSQANFASSCNIDSHFTSHQIVFDVTFYGDWAGNVWSTTSSCSALASTCNTYVANNPTAFAESYWRINSLKVYQSS